MGGRSSAGGNSKSSAVSSANKIIPGRPFVQRGKEYVDQISELSKGKKSAVKEFTESKGHKTITIINPDGTKEKITREIGYDSDAGRRYIKSTNDQDIFDQDSIYKGKDGSRYLVTHRTTITSGRYGQYSVNISATKVSKLKLRK